MLLRAAPHGGWSMPRRAWVPECKHPEGGATSQRGHVSASHSRKWKHHLTFVVSRCSGANLLLVTAARQ